MATVEAQPKLTPEQYLAWERAEEGERHEYYDGEIVTLPGAKLAHIVIVANFSRVIGNQIEDRPAQVLTTDMRVAVDPANTYVYPDIVVVRDEPRLLDDELDTLLNPVLVIEVLSPSTEVWDRGMKAARYRRLETLEEYAFVAQDRMRVEHFVRRGDEWVVTVLERPDDVLRLDSIECAVPLSAIYAKVIFPAPSDESA